MRSKKIILSLLTLFMLSTVIAQDNTRAKLIGKWEAKDADGTTGSLKFLDSVNIAVKIPGQLLPNGTYTIDITKNPMWFDIIFKEGDSTLVMKGLLKLTSDSTLKWQVFLSGNRSETFTDNDDDPSIILKKIE